MNDAPMMQLTRVYHFSAGHRLENPRLGAEENARLYGQCYRQHGHNYYLEVTVQGEPDPVTGMLVDITRIDDVVRPVVLKQVDHRAKTVACEDADQERDEKCAREVQRRDQGDHRQDDQRRAGA